MDYRAENILGDCHVKHEALSTFSYVALFAEWM